MSQARVALRIIERALEEARLTMTMVQVERLMLPEHRVEIEIEAVIGSAR